VILFRIAALMAFGAASLVFLTRLLDLLATLHTSFGSFLYLIECKRYRPDRPVGVRPVRELYGVLLRDRATAAALVTTSYFTEDATRFQRGIPYQLTLRNFGQLAAWIQRLQE
jgi:restriction system protein